MPSTRQKGIILIMKINFKNKLLLILFIAILLFSSVCMASDVAPISSDSDTDAVVTSEGDENQSYEYITSDVYEIGNDILIDTIIDGNVFTIGNNVTVTGEIGGDLFVIGSKVTVSPNAYIHGNIFVIAENFEMNGICYDIYAISDNFTLNNYKLIVFINFFR